MSDTPASNPPPPPSGPPSSPATGTASASSTRSAPSAPPGWHLDPFGRYDHRWFDGTAWTDRVSANGQPVVDPLGIAPGTLDPYRFDTHGADPHGYGAPPPKNRIAVAALVCGVIGLLIAWIPFIVAAGIVLAGLGLIFGIVGLRRSRDSGRGRGQAIAGIVTGSIGLALSVLGIVLSVLFWRAVSDFVDPGPYDVTVTGCTVDGGFATATGTLTNESAAIRSYTLFVVVDRRTTVVALPDIDAGDTIEWVERVRFTGVGTQCLAEVSVNGPFPFGVEMDPVEQ